MQSIQLGTYIIQKNEMKMNQRPETIKLYKKLDTGLGSHVL